MSLKDTIDYGDVVTDLGSLELESHAIRKSFQYDSYAGKTRFIAIVLSEPLPLQSRDAGHFTNTPKISTVDKIKSFFGIQGSAHRISKFTFRGRIVEHNSPHWFLPDPCDPAYAGGDSAELLKLIGMHTLFVSTEEYQLQAGKKLPNRGDLVLVDLENNIFGYNLQRGAFVDVIHATDAMHNITSFVGAACGQTLQASFAAHTGTGTAPSGYGSHQPNSPVVGGPAVTVRPCQPGELCDSYVQARYYRTANRDASKIRLIVIHATAGSAGTNKALPSMKRLARGPTIAVRAPRGYTGPTVLHGGKKRLPCTSGPCIAQGKPYQLKEVKSSAHYTVDQGGNVVQGVADKDVANHAVGVNNVSIGIEHTGTANDPNEWNYTIYDESAKLSAALCIKYNIPATRIMDETGTGFIGHVDTKNTTHTDPGPYWDWDKYLNWVQHYIDNPPIT